MSVNEDKGTVVTTAPAEVTEMPVMNARRELGFARGVTWEAPGWDAAMTDEEVDDFLGPGKVW